MNVALLGFDLEGHVSYDYFKSRGDSITICDQNTEIIVPDGVASQLGEHYLDDLQRFDVIVRTAGMPPHVITDKNPDVVDKVTTQTNEFFKVCPTKNIIGVTGTKGKGTTSTLITKMLEAAGKQVFLGGNIGIPVFNLLPQLHEDSWVVLELSSFQLIDLKQSPHIAVCLMVVPEHLNWHANMDEYVTAKSQLFAKQTSEDIAIYFADNDTSKKIAFSGAGQKLPYYTPPGAFVRDNTIVIDDQVICKTDEIKLLGQHNWQNACAAVTAVWQVTQDTEAMRKILTSFAGLEHRLEFVRDLNGVKYYDDSFGTTPETAIVALEAFKEPKVIILGGSDKGAEFDELAKAVAKNNVRQVVLIGKMAQKIETALHAQNFTNTSASGGTMEEIVAACQKVAQPGDIVLLSTACASFDMFKDYKERGNQFKTAVQALV